MLLKEKETQVIEFWCEEREVRGWKVRGSQISILLSALPEARYSKLEEKHTENTLNWCPSRL
jgi:hypothetical protein